MTLLKKYWLELIVFGGILAVLLIDLSPGVTWMNTDSDGAHYILAAKYMTTAHHMSAPLYLLIGNLFLRLPIATEAWRMGLISVLATSGSVIFIYLIVRRLLQDSKNARIFAIVSAIIYGGSALVISQSIIIETYSLATMCGLGAYYYAIKNRWLLSSIMIGIGLAVHPFLAFIVWVILFIAYKEMRNWRRYSVTIAFFAFYLYIPIVGVIHPTNMWGNTTSSGLFGGTFGMVFMLTGGLSVWDFPKRLLDTLLILGVSFGAGLIPLVWYFIKTKKLKNSLFWLVLIPVVYFAINLAAETYVYMIVAIAFGSIVVGLGLSKMRISWTWVTCLVAVGFLVFNVNYFDIGRTLDPEMSAEMFYQELDKIPDGDKFMGGGWTWAMVYVYNQEEGRNIIPISLDALPSDEYIGILDSIGIEHATFYPIYDDLSYITKQGMMAVSIAEYNEGVWIAKEAKPEVYQYTIELANGNESYIGRWIGQEIQPELKWRPSNPYKFISGQLEVAEWHHILWVQNATGLGQMLLILVLGIYGYGIAFIIVHLWKKRRESDEVITKS